MRRSNTITLEKSKITFMNLPVIDILHNPQKQWQCLQSEAYRNKRFAFRKIDIDWKEYNPKDYLFSHVSIVSSVETDQTGYRIIEPCDELVNANGNAWTNQVLPHCFRTFVGGYNFVEHIQIPELSKGKILDAILRPVVYIGKNGKKKANVYYVDLLIATARKFEDIVSRIEDGTLSTLSMGCFQKGTMVIMANGIRKPIEDFIGGELVISHTGKIKKVIKPIKTIWNGDIYKITVEGHEDPIVCTGNHKFYIAKEIEKCLCECIVRLEEARNLQKEDYLLIPAIHNGVKKVSLGLARLLGLYLAEGSLLKNDKGEYSQVEFTYDLKEKDTLAVETQKLLMEEFGISSSIYSRDEMDSVCVRSWTNTEVAEWFYKHGGKYSWNKIIGEDCFNWSKECLMSLIGGWLDGYGCKQKHRLVGVSVSDNMVHQISFILNKLGIYHRIENKEAYTSETEDGIIISHKKSWHITIPSSVIPKIASYIEKCNDCVHEFEKEFCTQLLDNYIMVKIKDIEQLRPISESNETISMYCLEIEDDHSFLVGNGVAVENCIANVTQCSYCGKQMRESDENCEHIKNHIGSFIKDKNGKEWIVSELVGAMDKNGKYIDDSCVFIEASWVEQPAFAGAVKNYFIECPKMKTNMIISDDVDKRLANLFDNEESFSKLKVADKRSLTSIRLTTHEIKKIRYQNIIKSIIKN